MTRETFLPDEQLPDIRPGDVVRLTHGQLTFTVDKVERTSTYACASLRPVVALTATGKPRPMQSSRTDKVVLVERPEGSEPHLPIPWDGRDLDRQLRTLADTDKRMSDDARRFEARLARLIASGVQVMLCEPGTVDGGNAYGEVTQWRNGADLVTRVSIDERLNASKRLRLLRYIEDELDDLTAGVSKFGTWERTERGEPWRSVSFGTPPKAAR